MPELAEVREYKSLIQAEATGSGSLKQAIRTLWNNVF